MPTAPFSDRELIDASRNGDPAAFSRLVERYQDLVAGTAYGWLGDMELARDVTQEVFLEAHLKLDQLREPAAFRGWLKRIVIKQCDRVTRRYDPGLTSLEASAPVQDPAAGPGKLTGLDEASDRLRLAVEGLPRAERMAVALHYFAEVSGAELAEYLGVPLSTIKKRLRSARARLKTEGERLMQETMRRMRPSRSADLTREVRFFLALRAGDRTEVGRLLAAEPSLADARQRWAPELVREGLLPFATNATALITAVELGDLDMLRMLLNAGADANGLCGCATAETPLWAAALFHRPAHAVALLEAGADPNLVSGSGNYPLHLAAMRGQEDMVELLLRFGADSTLEDAGPRYPQPFAPRDGKDLSRPGRTPAAWARDNGHAAVAARLESAEAATVPAAPTHGGVLRKGEHVHTGIKAIDLFVPLLRGGVVRVPFKAGVGMVVLLGELCSRFARGGAGAAVWTGFAQPPFDLQDWQAEMAELGLKDTVVQSLASFNQPSAARRAAFDRGVDAALRLAAAGRDVLAVVQVSDGFEADVDAALLRFAASAHEGSVTAMVITTFPGTGEDVWTALSAPFTSQIVLDRARAQASLYPAIDPAASLAPSAAGGADARSLLAARARELLDDYRVSDPELRKLDGHRDSPAVRLLRYLCQPFQVTEPFTGRRGQWVSREALFEEVTAILDEA